MLRIPSEEETFERLGPLKDLMYETLEAAVIAAKGHFEVNYGDHRFESSQFFSNHVREKFFVMLRPLAETYDFSVVDVPSCSFLLTSGPFVCKLFKAFNGEIPSPGSRKALLKYYKQNGRLLPPYQSTLPGVDFETKEPFLSPTTVHLVAYYDVSAHHELAWLKIACPKYATASHVDCFWDKLVPNPLESGGFSIQHSVEERKDLSFTLRREDISTELG